MTASLSLTAAQHNAIAPLLDFSPDLLELAARYLRAAAKPWISDAREYVESNRPAQRWTAIPAGSLLKVTTSTKRWYIGRTFEVVKSVGYLVAVRWPERPELTNLTLDLTSQTAEIVMLGSPADEDDDTPAAPAAEGVPVPDPAPQDAPALAAAAEPAPAADESSDDDGEPATVAVAAAVAITAVAVPMDTDEDTDEGVDEDTGEGVEWEWRWVMPGSHRPISEEYAQKLMATGPRTPLRVKYRKMDTDYWTSQRTLAANMRAASRKLHADSAAIVNRTLTPDDVPLAVPD